MEWERKFHWACFALLKFLHHSHYTLHTHFAANRDGLNWAESWKGLHMGRHFMVLGIWAHGRGLEFYDLSTRDVSF